MLYRSLSSASFMQEAMRGRSWAIQDGILDEAGVKNRPA